MKEIAVQQEEVKECGGSRVGMGKPTKIKAAREDIGNRKNGLSLPAEMQELWKNKQPPYERAVGQVGSWQCCCCVEFPRTASQSLLSSPGSPSHAVQRIPGRWLPFPHTSGSCHHYTTHWLWDVLLCTARRSTPSHLGVPKAYGLYFLLLYFKTSTCSINIYSWKSV